MYYNGWFLYTVCEICLFFLQYSSYILVYSLIHYYEVRIIVCDIFVVFLNPPFSIFLNVALWLFMYFYQLYYVFIFLGVKYKLLKI